MLVINGRSYIGDDVIIYACWTVSLLAAADLYPDSMLRNNSWYALLMRAIAKLVIDCAVTSYLQVNRLSDGYGCVFQAVFFGPLVFREM